MIRPVLLFASSISLAACAGGAAAAPPSAAFLAATLIAEDAAQAGTVPLKPPTVKATPTRKRHDGRAPTARVEAANLAAVQEPAPDYYVGAAQVYAWTEGALYRLYTAPERVSDIALQPGESLVSVAAGDTARWIIGDTTSGAGAARRTHVLVKPSAASLSTNLVIATDRRVYHVELQSLPHAAMASIAWTYPEDALLALRAATATADTPVAAGITVEALNFNYRIEGDRPEWRPLRAFDDGHQVFIEFPPTLPEGEAPPLFVTGEGGRAELVNYRLRGRYYVVDRLFAAAELRLGERRQQVVRILREGAGRGKGRS
jgi:type IV secretion system protein VirB9